MLNRMEKTAFWGRFFLQTGANCKLKASARQAPLSRQCPLTKQTGQDGQAIKPEHVSARKAFFQAYVEHS